MVNKKCYQCGNVSGRGSRQIVILCQSCRTANDKVDAAIRAAKGGESA